MKTLLILMTFCAVQSSLAQDAGQKLDRFRAETNLVARTGMIGDLMQTGGELAFLEFKRSLFDTNLARRQLNFREEVYMLGLVSSMGYLAVTSNIVRDFLVEAVNPKFWKTNISWKAELGEQEHDVLAGYALVSLAVSGSPAFHAIAGKLKEDVSIDRRDYLVSALVDAHFRKELVERKGWESYVKIGSDEARDAFREWKQTPAGSNWVQWSRSIKYPSPAARE